jgi:multidrug efflux system membrane fusion protein
MRWSPAHLVPTASLSGLLALSVLTLVGCGKPAEPPEPVRAVRTLVVASAQGTLEREFSADVRARTESRLSFRVPGKITRRAVDLGQRVGAGQLLAQIDPQDLRFGAEAAKAALSAAEAQAAQVSADVARFKELRAQGFISAAELERHSTAERAAHAALRQARAQAGVQSNQAGYAALTADAAGVITSVDVEPGQVVGAGQPVLMLAHDGPRDVVFSVPEDMGALMRALIAKPAGIKVRRWGSAEWAPGVVREVAGATDMLTRTLLVKADIGGLQAELGQTATVLVRTSNRAKAEIQLPLHALMERDGRSVVWVLDAASMTIKPQSVVTGEVVGNVVTVTQGLDPGQEVVTAGVHVLTPGQKVKRYVEPGQGVRSNAASASSPRS